MSEKEIPIEVYKAIADKMFPGGGSLKFINEKQPAMRVILESFILCVVFFFFSIITIYTIAASFEAMLNGELDIFVIIILCSGVLFFTVKTLISSFRTLFGALFLSRDSLDPVFSQAQILNGQITKTFIEENGKQPIEYSFINPSGENISDVFFSTYSKKVAIGDKVSIFYINDRLHTLMPF
jgi:hypothetical protein